MSQWVAEPCCTADQTLRSTCPAPEPAELSWAWRRRRRRSQWRFHQSPRWFGRSRRGLINYDPTFFSLFVYDILLSSPRYWLYLFCSYLQIARSSPLAACKPVYGDKNIAGKVIVDVYIIGASLSEPHLVRTMISLSVYIYRIYIYISYVRPFGPEWGPP